MKPRKFGSSMFGNKGRPATGAAVNKPKMQRGKKAFFSEGGEISQADIDKMSYNEAFKHFRAKGKGTTFTYKGSKQAAYRKGEEPESFKKNVAKPKTEAPNPAPASASTPFGVAFEKARAAKASTFDYEGDNKFGMGGKERHKAGKYTTQLKMAEGGSVESKAMMKKEIGFMKAKSAPKSMVKHEMAEAKGMKKGGMACGGMKKYARGGGVESHGKTKGTMVRMASGGSVSARADGIASKGKTNCKIC
jgi:hypothetical protein